MRTFTRESLQYISDYDVEKHYRSIQDKIFEIRKSKNRSSRTKEQKTMLEIEACYVYREIEHRRARKEAHAKYILGVS
mgnify:CR=1 FL=1